MPPVGKGPPLAGKAAGKGLGPAPLKGKGAPPPLRSRASTAPVSLEEPAAVKLRPLFWTTTRQVEPESVWASVAAPAPFDAKRLERQFVLQAPRGAPGTPKYSARGSVTEERKKIRVLDDRTSQNLEIAFRKLPQPRELARLVERLENFPEGLNSEALLALHNAGLEQQEAIEQIRSLALTEADVQLLDIPERYLWVLGTLPCCSAKLACGALLVGSAGEIADLRVSGERVIACCLALRNSALLRKCLSTALAVGNLLNRGTSRAAAQGVLLPDALLKLDELRGIAADAAPDSVTTSAEGRGPSVLDFVAVAMVQERRSSEGLAEGLEALRAEAEKLLLQIRRAQAVPLEEAETSCRKVQNQAQRAEQGLQSSKAEERASSGTARLAERVRRVCEEANIALSLLVQAKEELARTLQWCSSKDAKVKSSDWFALWAQFLDQLCKAFGRVRLPAPVRSATSASPTPSARLAQLKALQQASLQVPACRVAVEGRPKTAILRSPPPTAVHAVPPLEVVNAVPSLDVKDCQSDVSEIDGEVPGPAIVDGLRRRSAGRRSKDAWRSSSSLASEDPGEDDGSRCASPARKLYFPPQTPVASPPARHVRNPTAEDRPIDSVTRRRRNVQRLAGTGGG